MCMVEKDCPHQYSIIVIWHFACLFYLNDHTHFMWQDKFHTQLFCIQPCFFWRIWCGKDHRNTVVCLCISYMHSCINLCNCGLFQRYFVVFTLDEKQKLLICVFSIVTESCADIHAPVKPCLVLYRICNVRLICSPCFQTTLVQNIHDQFLIRFSFCCCAYHNQVPLSNSAKGTV